MRLLGRCLYGFLDLMIILTTYSYILNIFRHFRICVSKIMPYTFIILLIWEFFTPALSDSFTLKSAQAFRTLLCILANFNNAVVRIVATHPFISTFSSPCNNPLVTVSIALITVTFRSLVKQTTTRNIYITIYIYFLDRRLCEVGAVRRGIRIVRLWGLNSSM